jgi:hypothetical protein
VGIDYYYYGFIGWRLPFGDIVELCRENGMLSAEHEDYYIQICNAVDGGALDALLKCHTKETGSGTYNDMGHAFVCLYVNEDPERDHDAFQTVAEANYDPYSGGELGEKDEALFDLLMKKWGPTLKDVKERATELGLRLGEPQIFLDLRES